MIFPKLYLSKGGVMEFKEFTKKEILNSKDIKNIINRMAHEIIEKNAKLENLVFIGIQTKGVFVAQRLTQIIEKVEKIKIPFGTIDVNLYRDDILIMSTHPVVKKTEIDFNVEGKNIILVDDVLYTGRTIRAALDEIIDLGRPARVQLAVLIDRGHRELPIQADYTGKNIPTSAGEIVEVHMAETNDTDFVELIKTK